MTMKTNQLPTKSLLLALAAWCAAMTVSLKPAQAATITWGIATNIVDSSDVLKTGSPMYAYAFGTDVGAQTVNTVAFAVGNGSGGGTNVTVTGAAACGPYFPLSSPPSYNGILKGAAFASSGSGATMTVTLKNLVEGQQYAVQVWSSNVDYGGTPTTYDGAVSLTVSPGQYAIGTFTADATGTQAMILTQNNVQLNALQVRTVPAPGTPPTVAIDSPANNATVLRTFTIDATASDDGTIASVAFSYSTDAGATWHQLGAADTVVPYSYTWSGAPEGTYQLKAVAVDNDAMSTTSAVVNVTVIDPPTVAITSPANNATVGVNFTIDATATDNGTITKVAFFDGTTQLGPDVTGSGPTYSYVWNGAPNGLHVLTAVATDNDGHSTTSALVNVWVTNITWGAAQNITDDNDVLKTGDLVYAYAFGNGGATVNTVPFAAGNVWGGGTDVTFGYATASYSGPYFGPDAGLSAEYNTILTGANWTYTAFPLTLSNLTPGTAYTVQVWSNNNNPNTGATDYTSLDGLHLLGKMAGNGDRGQYATGTFTAIGTSQVIAIGGVPQELINAIQVRTVPIVAGYEKWSEQIPAGQRGRTDDPDGDGFTNLQEFLFGTSPIAGNGALVTSETVGGNLVLHWLQRETGSTYLLKESTTMAAGDWSTSAVVPVPDDQTGAPVDYDRYKATITIGAARKFFRVEGAEN